MSLIESTLHPEAAVFRHVIPAGEPYLFEVKAGQTLRILDRRATRLSTPCSTA